MQRNRLLSSITHASLTLLVGLAMLLLLPAHAPAQTVLSRARIGGYAEDITFVPSGPLKDHIVIADGYEVYGVRIKNKDKGEPLVKLFDLRALAIDIRPNGITYI